ncbi:diacylglycerol kinase [Alteromonas sp. AMM-1]|uniref:diacylglycerol kinase n=1 Tax=Alteromonas sp. AMM-1 TaxID=3394233 RepID=UPI0039A630FC
MPINKETHFDTSNKPSGLTRIVLAMGNSIRAIRWLIQHESAFRQEMLLLFLSLVVLFYWDIALLEKAVLLVSILFIMFAEIVNTAIEATIDRVGLELHPLSGLAKDLGSAAVLIAILIGLLSWGTVIITHSA